MTLWDQLVGGPGASAPVREQLTPPQVAVARADASSWHGPVSRHPDPATASEDPE